MEPLYAFLGIVVVSFLSPAVLLYMTGRAAAKKEERDYARQDLVAERAADAAAQISEANNIQDKKLDMIHTLVNSNLTSQMQDTHDTAVLLLASLQGQKKTPAVDVAIALAESKIATLDKSLIDRAKQQEIVEHQEANAKAEGLGTVLPPGSPPIAPTAAAVPVTAVALEVPTLVPGSSKAILASGETIDVTVVPAPEVPPA